MNYERDWDGPYSEDYFEGLYEEPTPGSEEPPIRDSVQRRGFSIGQANLVRISEVARSAVRWLWPGRIPLGKITLIDGDPGQGKSTMTLDLAARVSRGWAMPDGVDGVGPAGVVVLSAEDGLGDTLRPRLEAAGANLDLVHAFTGVRDSGSERLPMLPQDVPRLEAVAVATGSLMVVIDPLMAYLGANVNSFRDQDVRRALAPLAAMAERTGVAVLVVRHLNKASGGSAIYRGGGSIGIAGAARSVLLVARDPDAGTDDPNPRKILAVVKSNLAVLVPSMAYQLLDSPDHGCARVRWEAGTTPHRADDLLAGHHAASSGSALREASDFLRDLLSGGSVTAQEVRAAAKAAGIAWGTVHRARTELTVVARKRGAPGGDGQHWEWELPDEVARG